MKKEIIEKRIRQILSNAIDKDKAKKIVNLFEQVFAQQREKISKKITKKMPKLIYFEPSSDDEERSQEQLLKEKAIVGTFFIVDEITGKEWGDDWNDIPKSLNAGRPYPEKCKNLREIEIKLGESLPNSDIELEKEN